LRTLLTVTGVVLIIVSPIVGAIPGPGGIFVFAAGLALMLQNAHWAKRGYARLKRRWPKLGKVADLGLRRASALRRAERDREAKTPGSKPKSTFGHLIATARDFIRGRAQ